jgi:hypothetical protein
MGRKGHEKVAKHLEEHVEECLPAWPSRRATADTPVPQAASSARPGDKAQGAGGGDLSKQGCVSALDERIGCPAIRGIGYGEALPGHGGIAGAPLRKPEEAVLMEP